MVTKLVVILIVALLAESIWETIKPIWDSKKFNVDRLGALGLGIVVAVAARIDIFAVCGISLINPIIGYILTGILISRGANFVHDLMKKVEKLSGSG